MTSGRVLVAELPDAYVLKLTGDVRLTLCTTIDAFIQSMFRDDQYRVVMVDLTEAEFIDSTTLGILAKMALHIEQRFHEKPMVFTTNPDIIRLLLSMGFDQIFDIVEGSNLLSPERELEAESPSEAAAHEKVLEAHRVLMELNEENRASFRELVETLGAIKP